MGPQNGSKSDRQLYGGSGDYSPSERANKAVSTAMQGGANHTPTVGETSGSAGSGMKPQGGDSPKQNTGGTPPSPKQQEAARYSEPSGSSVNDEKA